MKTKKKFIVVLTSVLLALLVAVLCFGCSSAKSAYDIAVSNGFTGTETEWLASLKGEEGASGSNGISVSYSDYVAWLQESGNAGKTWEDFLATMGISNTVEDTAAVTSSVARSSVLIRAGYSIENSQVVSQAGSGVLIAGDQNKGEGYIVTNYHVLYVTSAAKVANNIFVYLYGYEPIYGEMITSSSGSEQYASLYNGTPIKATYIGGSMLQDIAVVKIESNVFKNSESRILDSNDIADSDDVTLGSSAIAVGNPMALGFAATYGVVSKTSEHVTMAVADDRTISILRCFRIDVAINGGNSGGGLFDSKGRLIGIVNAKLNKTNIENVAYAIPANLAISIANSIIDGNVDTDKIAMRCILGIEPQVYATKSVYENNALRTVQTIRVGSISSKYNNTQNQLQVNDIILSASINGKTVVIDQYYQLNYLLFGAKVGDTLTLDILRDNEQKTVQINLTTSYSADNSIFAGISAAFPYNCV